jgi:hypothetical protein
MSKIKLIITIGLCLIGWALGAQNIFNITKKADLCYQANGSITLDLINAESPEFPLPYTVGIKIFEDGTNDYKEEYNLGKLI